ncbi:MAG TPA: cob(I)yrinic acid a,c-diamide adenosyltransferase [Candidatus Acidoferrum sp.]|nr:cob(I)yrinic acid a,c-diamide adenosyltransferase [Candidatus Methylomirabilis sp.]HWU39775.1 cob(I)yrinic acid a,c-diamide adenosyltransferase [Candidatus Acidoferrum sp.]
MKIYTRTGDAGQTGLLGAGRVRKNAARVEAYGGVDELNATLGVIRAALTDPELLDLLASIQRDLFAMGTLLADARKDRGKETEKATLTPERVTDLERAIDRFEEELPPLRRFIFPGGCETGSRLHLARTVCRRAERRIVALAAEEMVPAVILAYVNRLSDLLFVMARVVNHRAGVAEIVW